MSCEAADWKARPARQYVVPIGIESEVEHAETALDAVRQRPVLPLPVLVHIPTATKRGGGAQVSVVDGWCGGWIGWITCHQTHRSRLVYESLPLRTRSAPPIRPACWRGRLGRQSSVVCTRTAMRVRERGGKVEASGVEMEGGGGSHKRFRIGRRTGRRRGRTREASTRACAVSRA